MSDYGSTGGVLKKKNSQIAVCLESDDYRSSGILKKKIFQNAFCELTRDSRDGFRRFEKNIFPKRLIVFK